MYIILQGSPVTTPPTSIVLPFMAVTTSPGLMAEPEGMFSQSGIRPTTLRVVGREGEEERRKWKGGREGEREEKWESEREGGEGGRKREGKRKGGRGGDGRKEERKKARVKVEAAKESKE